MRPKNVTALRRTQAVCIVPVKILAYARWTARGHTEKIGQIQGGSGDLIVNIDTYPPFFRFFFLEHMRVFFVTHEQDGKTVER